MKELTIMCYAHDFEHLGAGLTPDDVAFVQGPLYDQRRDGAPCSVCGDVQPLDALDASGRCDQCVP
jgi:hypothetical protein